MVASILDLGESVAAKIAESARLLAEAQEELRQQQARATELAASVYPLLEREDFAAFLREPYVLVPRGKNQWFCLVPKFIQFSVGWLHQVTQSYNIFLINRYSLWLGDVPESIRLETGLEQPPGDLQVLDGQLLFSPQHRDAAAKYKGFLSRLQSNSGTIIRGREFDLLAKLVEDGYLPFVPRPVAEADRRQPQVKFNFEGKYAFQQAAYEEFMRRGAVGIYFMTGGGKSFVSMAALDSLNGPKLIIVPTRTLVEQWRELLRTWAPRLYSEHISGTGRNTLEIVTYNSYEKVRQGSYVLTVYDEAHRLPANSFSRLATIKTKYRIGGSGSPKREDSRENYILALTGWPIGQDWRSLVAMLGKNFHAVAVHIVPTQASKLRKVEELYAPGRKTLVFADAIDFGADIARRLNVPHIYSKTKNRVETARSARAFVASRVMDEGVSIEDLDHIIEADFLFGSQRQQLQRTGRLLHSSRAMQHDILMTRAEFDSYGKRLHALVEKGFKVSVYA